MAHAKSNQMDFRGLEVLADQFTGKMGGALVGQTPVSVTFTAANPNLTPDGAVTIANGGTPTVVELQHFCLELNEKLNAIINALD